MEIEAKDKNPDYTSKESKLRDLAIQWRRFGIDKKQHSRYGIQFQWTDVTWL
jgi:hypothetical protein